MDEILSNPALGAIVRRAAKLGLILEVARSLATERDLDRLLSLILAAGAKVAEADRCSIFLVDRDRNELWTRLAQGMDAGKEIRTPLGVGIVGHVASTGRAINIPNAYDDARFNRSVDQDTGYHTQNLLTVPMTIAGGAASGEAAGLDGGAVVGVIQVLNRTDQQPFTPEDQELLEGLGAQAAAAIENAVLNQEIRKLFEGFVQASVTAIESRDPTTAGHSERVAKLTIGLAKTLALVPTGEYAGKVFTVDQIQELRYASLLHDFGKVGVREHVLVKANKLFPHELAAVEGRFDLIRRTRELESAQRCIALLGPSGAEGIRAALREEDARRLAELAELDRLREFVRACNQPNVVAGGEYGKLRDYLALQYQTIGGAPAPYLSTDEVERLSILRGSLSEAERHEIESHVIHTYEFLRRIPWTRDLRRIPDLAHGHHERLDGSGYPMRLGSDHIPVETRMMTISDIYDALTASDRPYKKAVPHDRALGILEEEAKRGFVDRELLTIFIEAKVPAKVLG